MLGIYIRKSRERKKEKSLKEQKLLGQEFATEQDMKYKFYNEGVISGQKDEKQRPIFAELLQDIENGNLKGVYIWDSSRIARNEDAWQTFAKSLKKTGTFLYDNGVKADFEDDNTYLFYYMKSGFDAHFARLTSKKIKTVLKRNAMEGLPNGILPYGYTTTKKGKWKKHKDEIETVETIFDLYEKGYGYIRIANHLNELGTETRYNIEWTPATIRYMIYNKTYSGRAKFNDITIKVPPIIDPKRHDKLIASIGTRYKKSGAKSKKFILNEVLVCGKCGTRYTISQRHRHSYYRCLSEVNRGVPKCFSKAIRSEHIDKLLLEKVLLGNELYELAEQTYLEGGNLEQKKELKTKLAYHNGRLEKLEGELKRSYQVFVLGGVELELYMSEKKRIDRQLLKTQDTIDKLTNDLERIQDTKRLLEDLSLDFNVNLPDIWKDEKDPTMRALKQHAIKQAITDNRLERNRATIVETMTFDEKIAMVEKYIKEIKVDYHALPLRLTIEFNIPVPPMIMIMESRYYAAMDKRTERIHLLRDMGKRPNFIYKRTKQELNESLENYFKN
jgi:site-specific DNA recombinase